MPQYELLGYGKVVEERALYFFDLAQAARDFLRDHGTEMFETLAECRFVIEGSYREEDPELADPGRLAIVYPDVGGWRFHYGGSLKGGDPEAAYVEQVASSRPRLAELALQRWAGGAGRSASEQRCSLATRRQA